MWRFLAGIGLQPELTPLLSAILVHGDGPQRQIERKALPDIRTAIEEHPKFILLAQPGAGKTTVLQRIALDKALDCLQGKIGAQLPLYVQLADQQAHETPHAFLARKWREAMPGRAADSEREVQAALTGRRLCLLVDALNEARREQYAERMRDWRAFAAGLEPGNRLVFSCRKLDYTGEVAVQQVEIDPLTPAQVSEFAVRHLGESKGAAFGKALQAQHADLRELAETPYYLHRLVDVYDVQNDLPANRARLFDQFVKALLNREESKNHAVAWIDAEAQQVALSELAYAMQQGREGTQVDLKWAKEKLPAQVTLPSNDRTVPTPPDVLLALAWAATILAGNDKVKFTHHLMQEYFAAIALLHRLLARGEDLSFLWRVPSGVAEMRPAERGEWDALPGPPTSGWEETTILAAGLYPAVYDAVRRVNVALAARCLLESRGEADATRIKRSQDDLLARLGSVSVHVRSRIEAGLLLGRLGDPRFPVETVNGVKVILPPMVAIAGGKAKIGSGFSRHTVTLGNYAIGRFPVTNIEYACFMEAGGYEDERFWTGDGRYWLRGEKVPGKFDRAGLLIEIWRRQHQYPHEVDLVERSGKLTSNYARYWRTYIQWPEHTFSFVDLQFRLQPGLVGEPLNWQIGAFNNLSQPVVGVCWYEAMAYANWLASVTGQPYRLLTEPEWEWAARRGKRNFAWGSDWDASKLNCRDGNDRVMRTTPVGAYPQGTTPDGIHDLSGNVYEWTATRYAEYPYKMDADLENPDATGERILRGGGWSDDCEALRCTSRSWDLPWLWNSAWGMRLARTFS